MDKNIVEFDDYNVGVDLREIDNMTEKEIIECKELIKEIQEMI